MLARIILAEKYGIEPVFVPKRPDLASMLSVADAALIIGDPALALDPAELPWHVLDLGEEWFALTGLPMVFAVWAGEQRKLGPAVRKAFLDSFLFGFSRIEDIIDEAPATHGVPQELARRYLTRHIVFRLHDEEHRGLDLFRRKVADVRAAGTDASGLPAAAPLLP
jgi:predicted solute-binding protein